MPHLYEMLPYDGQPTETDVIVAIPQIGKPKGITLAQIRTYLNDRITNTVNEIQQQQKVDGLKWVDQTYNITASDNIIRVEAIQDTYLLLPDAATVAGQVLIVKNISFSERNKQGYAVILVPIAGQAVNSRGYKSLPPRTTVSLFSDGNNWETLGE